MRLTIITGAAALLAAAALPAMAQTAVTAVTDLNVRAGPGPQYQVIGVMPIDSSANLNGCAEGSSWCSVTWSGGDGWVSSDYLAADMSGTRVIVTERRADLDVPVMTHDGDGLIAGAATGAITGAIVGGPVGAAVGGVAGAATGAIVEDGFSEPSVEVRRYITDNPVDPVYLDGEVVVGAELPDTVVMREIPDYEYRYVYVNGQPVVIEPGTRRVVYIVR